MLAEKKLAFLRSRGFRLLQVFGVQKTVRRVFKRVRVGSTGRQENVAGWWSPRIHRKVLERSGRFIPGSGLVDPALNLGNNPAQFVALILCTSSNRPVPRIYHN